RGVCGRSWSQLHMTHEPAGALQQAGRIRQRRAVKKPNVYVGVEYIDVTEGRVSQTGNRTAVMQKLADFVPACSHHRKPLTRDGSQFTCVLFQPSIDGRIPLDSAGESQQFGAHHRSTFGFKKPLLHSTLARELRGWRNVVLRKDATAFQGAAVRECELHAMTGIAEGGDARAEKNRVNVEADTIDQALGEEGLRQFATAHQADIFAWRFLEGSDKVGSVAVHEFDVGIVDIPERAGEDIGTRAWDFILAGF